MSIVSRLASLRRSHFAAMLLAGADLSGMGQDGCASCNPPPPQTLSVIFPGDGAGRVTSSPAGVDCQASCSVELPLGSTLTLSASPGASSSFAQWAGDCSGSGPCTVTMSKAKAVSATFHAVAPPACPTPAPGHICVRGDVRHLLDNHLLGANESAQVALFDPLSFMANPNGTPLASQQTSNATFMFPSAPTPALGLLSIVVSGSGLQPTAVMLDVIAGQSYTADGFATPQTLVTGWSASGIDYDQKGAIVLQYFLDAGNANDTMPAAAVRAIADGSPATAAKYFDADLSQLGVGTSTAGAGAAILAGTAGGSILAFSGAGAAPGSKWETFPGATPAHAVFVHRFHPCQQDMAGNCTN